MSVEESVGRIIAYLDARRNDYHPFTYIDPISSRIIGDEYMPLWQADLELIIEELNKLMFKPIKPKVKPNDGCEANPDRVRL